MLLKHFVVYFMYLTFCHFVRFRLVVQENIDDVYIQLFRERLSEKNVHATTPKGNMGHDQYTVPETVAVEPTFRDWRVHFFGQPFSKKLYI